MPSAPDPNSCRWRRSRIRFRITFGALLRNLSAQCWEISEEVDVDPRGGGAREQKHSPLRTILSSSHQTPERLRSFLTPGPASCFCDQKALHNYFKSFRQSQFYFLLSRMPPGRCHRSPKRIKKRGSRVRAGILTRLQFTGSFYSA